MENEVDKYGNVIARTILNSGDFGRAHDELKIMTNALFRQAGCSTTIGPPNLFHGKVPGVVSRHTSDFIKRRSKKYECYLLCEDSKNR